MYNRPDGISHRKSSRVERRTTRSKSTSWWSPAWAGVEGATVPRKRRGPGDPQRQEQPDQERCDRSEAPTGYSGDSLEIAIVSREYFQHLPCILFTCLLSHTFSPSQGTVFLQLSLSIGSFLSTKRL